MLTPEQILKIAQDLQTHIPELLPADRAAEVDRQLTKLITQYNAGEDVAQDVFDLLNGQPELSQYISTHPTSYNKGITSPPGNSAPIPASEDTPFKGIPTPEPPKTDNPTQK
jgi:hypothetical protein